MMRGWPRHVLLVAAILPQAAALAACASPPEWLVYGSSDSERSVIVRVEFDGATRQARLEPYVEGQIIAVDHPVDSGTVTIIDAETCEELAQAPLPTGQVVVTFHDDPTSGDLVVSVGQRNVGRSGRSLPEDRACLG